MASLPTPGGDTGTWGSELNEFLLVSHNADGTLIGGGGSPWETLIDESGSSLANFTTDTGSWSTSGGIISIDATGGSGRIAHNTDATYRRYRAPWFLRADMKIRSDGVLNNGRGGLLWYWDGVNDNDPLVRFLYRTAGTERVEIENDSVAGIAGVDFAWSLDTWYTIEVAVNTYGASVSVDGSWKVAGTVSPGGAGHTQCKVGFYAASAKVDFRNLKVFAMTLPT